MSQKLSNVPTSVFLGLLVSLLAGVLSTATLAGDLRAYFDRKSVFEGDRVTLVIETTSGTLGQPDLSGLDADFELLGTSQSTNISIINGQRTDTVRLLVTLAPRHTGSIQVPPIQIGSERTQPLRLQVSELPQGGSGGAGGDIFVELEVGDGASELMVQQQVPMTLRLFTAAPLLEGTLDDPRVDGAVVTKLGEDREYDTRRNGREYQVVERSYSLSPERSGELRIPPVRFEGSVRTTEDRRSGSRRSLFDDPFFDRFFQDSPLSRDPFGMFDRGQRVSARSRGITLDVKARPGGYAGDHWLPAQALEIVDSWADTRPHLRVGQPVTRTLTLRAKGLSGPQIPQIEIPATPGLRVYPEKTESETRSDGETIYGISRQGVTLIPTKAGELMMPEIQVTWWDTTAQRERVTRVSGWTLKVTGGTGTDGVPESDVHPVPEARMETAEQIMEEPAEGPDIDNEPAGIDSRYLATGAMALVVLLVGAGVWGLYRRRHPSRVFGPARQMATTDNNAVRIRASEAKKALRVACEANDARSAVKALLDWAEATWPEDAPRNLGTLGTRLLSGGEQVRELERRLYAPAAHRWDGAALWQALQGGLSDARTLAERQADVLEPLYPSRSRHFGEVPRTGKRGMGSPSFPAT